MYCHEPQAAVVFRTAGGSVYREVDRIEPFPLTDTDGLQFARGNPIMIAINKFRD